MRTEYLTYFKAVVDCGSIAAAAETLFISPQGLSQAVQQLEKELDIKLFTRTANRLILTRAGEIAYDGAARLLALNSELQTNLSLYRAAASPETQERLIIYANHASNTSIIPKLLPRYHRLRPAVKIQIVEQNSLELFDSIQREEPAVFFFGLPDFEFARVEHLLSDLEYRILVRSRLLGCMSTQSPLAERQFLTLNDLKHHPLIVHHQDVRLIQGLLGDINDLNIILHSINLQLCKAMTAMDRYALSLTNEFMERYHSSPILTTRPFAPPIEMIFGYFVSAAVRTLPQVDLLLSLISAESII